MEQEHVHLGARRICDRRDVVATTEVIMLLRLTSHLIEVQLIASRQYDEHASRLVPVRSEVDTRARDARAISHVFSDAHAVFVS